MRYFIELRYNGGAYCGWQRQPDMPSVQQTIEGAISTLLREPILLTGAGRTDTGVNASYYVAHFDTSSPVADPEQVVFKLNHMLPGDIAVSRIVPVAADAHARFSAREREYRYYIEPRKNPFTRAASWQYYVPLDVAAMNRAADVLMEFEDFTSFAKLNSDNKTNICHLKRADWTVGRAGTVRFALRFVRTAFCGIWCGLSSARWSMWAGDVIPLNSSATSSPAAIFRGRAPEHPPRAFS